MPSSSWQQGGHENSDAKLGNAFTSMFALMVDGDVTHDNDTLKTSEALTRPSAGAFPSSRNSALSMYGNNWTSGLMAPFLDGGSHDMGFSDATKQADDLVSRNSLPSNEISFVYASAPHSLTHRSRNKKKRNSSSDSSTQLECVNYSLSHETLKSIGNSLRFGMQNDARNDEENEARTMSKHMEEMTHAFDAYMAHTADRARVSPPGENSSNNFECGEPNNSSSLYVICLQPARRVQRQSPPESPLLDEAPCGQATSFYHQARAMVQTTEAIYPEYGRLPRKSPYEGKPYNLADALCGSATRRFQPQNTFMGEVGNQLDDVPFGVRSKNMDHRRFPHITPQRGGGWNADHLWSIRGRVPQPKGMITVAHRGLENNGYTNSKISYGAQEQPNALPILCSELQGSAEDNPLWYSHAARNIKRVLSPDWSLLDDKASAMPHGEGNETNHKREDKQEMEMPKEVPFVTHAGKSGQAVKHSTHAELPVTSNTAVFPPLNFMNRDFRGPHSYALPIRHLQLESTDRLFNGMRQHHGPTKPFH